MTDFQTFTAEQARLTILKALSGENDGRLNEVLLAARLDEHGYRKSREWVRTQLRALAELGAVTVAEPGSAMVASITRLGLAHVERRQIIDGVARPSPEI